MSQPASPDPSTSTDRPQDDRLHSWKEIAAYLRRDVTTVQRWEKREGMPVHRHVHDKMGSVYAFRAELDAWTRGRAAGSSADSPADPAPTLEGAPRRARLAAAAAAAAVVVTAAGIIAWQMRGREPARDNPLATVRFSQLTDFGGTARAAAISRDGRFVAFLSDRDGRMDVWVSQIGAGQFHNLTRDAPRELVNPSVRTLGFSPDGTMVTFWTRRTDPSHATDIGIWAASILGGPPRPYLDDVAEFDWSPDGAQLVYHTPGPGDPMFVSASGQKADARQIFSAPSGLHSHFPIWSPDQRFIYFVQGSLPAHLDIWRISPAGGTAERITRHDSLVSDPVFIDARTLAYLASDADGAGPWIHSVDVEHRVPVRLSVGVDRYTSLAATADGRRLVATRSSPKATFWRLPMAKLQAGLSAAQRISLTTANGSAPRLGAGYLLYVASNGASDSIWKLQGDASTQIWTAPDARVIGAPAIARDERRLAFAIRQHGRTSVRIANLDGTAARIVTDALDLQGGPAWAPDGSLTVAAVTGSGPRLFRVPIDGGAPAPLLGEYATDPVWAPDGNLVIYSGPDIGTTFPVKAATADARPFPLAALTLSRGARHLAFLPGQRALVVLRGEIRHKNLWAIDLETGAERQLTDLAPDVDVRDFDIAPDGREIVLERIEDRSDIVLLELPRR